MLKNIFIVNDYRFSNLFLNIMINPICLHEYTKWCSLLKTFYLALGPRSETLIRQELMELSLSESLKGDKEGNVNFAITMGQQVTVLNT